MAMGDAPHTQITQGNFVAMRVDDLWLVVPQDQVARAGRREYSLASAVPSGIEGVFVSRSEVSKNEMSSDTTDELSASAYVALSSDMKLLGDMPPQRYLVTVFKNNHAYWCWSDVEVLINESLHCYPLPSVIKKASTPVHNFVKWGDGFQGFLCDVNDITQFALDKEQHACLIADAL